MDADPTLPPVWSGGTLSARASIQIAGDAIPAVLSVTAPNTYSGMYGVGEAIYIEVTFSTRVFVKSSHSLPYLLVEAGEDRTGEAKVCDYKLPLAENKVGWKLNHFWFLKS